MNPIQGWADFMRFKGASPRTVTSRTAMLRRVEREHGDPLTLTKADLIAFLAPYSHASTRSTMLSYLRSFYSWALSEDLVAEDPTARIPSVKVPAGVPRPAPAEVIDRMLATASPRTRSMAALMVYAGMRCFEVAAFRPEHLQRHPDGRWWVDIPTGKGGHHQAVPIPAHEAEMILAGPSWAVTVQTVQKDVRDALRAVGSDCTPHQLRHAYGTTMLRSTGNLAKVQRLMRHASPVTTTRYAKVEDEELSAAVEAAFTRTA